MLNRNRFSRLLAAIITLSLVIGSLPLPAGRVTPGVQPAQAQTLPQTAADNAQPAALAQAISIARAQSHYQVGGALTITYAVQNNQSASRFPDISAGLSVTDTVAALSGYDPLDDPHTLRGVIVSTELTNGAAFLDGSIWPDVNGSQLVFQLGDIAPRASVVFSMTVSTPASAADFVELDGGAAAFGTLQGRMATAVAPSIRLAPDGFANWLVSTPDAARDDQAMLFQLAELGDDPLALFDFVQGLSYEAYDGSLRGTRGTLWSEAGNSADQSSLLIAMLRAAGYPARYRHGALSQADAQTLIASMFPTPQVIRGHVPADAAVGDPLNDPDLLALVQDHWWVEAYLPVSGWTDLDPTIASAAPGDVFATPAQDGTDQIPELPDAIRHKLAFSLDAEQYNSFPLGGLNLQQTTVLTAVIPTAQTAGLPVNIAFAVESDVQGGVFTNARHTYTPYLAYGDSAETIFGTPIQDLLTNFPLATRFTTGIWLEVTSTAPDGRSDTYRRTIKDLIGPDLRQGGNAQLPPRDNSPLLSTSDLIQVQPIPNSAYPAAEADRALHAIYQQAPALVAAFNGYQTLTDEASDIEVITAFIDEQMPALYNAQFAQLDLMSAMFQFATTWEGKPMSADTVLVESYPDRPKLILSSQVTTDEGSLQTSFELLNIAEKAIPYPGQNLEAVISANFLRTTAEKSMEYALLDLFLPGEVHSAVRTLLAADEQGIPTRFILAENLAELDELAIPDETKAHIANYANTGALVAVPEQMVPMPYGEDIGFMVVAPDGNASYVNADGYTAAAALFYAIQNREVILVALVQSSGLAFVGGFLAYIFNFFAEVFLASLGLPELGPGDLSGSIVGNDPAGKGNILGLILAAKAAIPLPIGSCGASPNPPACQAGVMAGYGTVIAALVGGLAGGALDPSLTDFWVSDLPLPAPATVSAATLTAVPTLSGPVNLNVTAVHHWSSSPDLASDWASSHAQAAQFDSLTAASADLSQGGVLLGSGSLVAENGRAQFGGASQQWSLAADGAVAGYAPAADGLGITQVGAYTATSDAPQARLLSPYATLNGADPYSGELEAAFSSAVTLAGRGAAPAPNFAAAHTMALAQGQVMVSGIDGGTVTVGGTAVPNLQSLALANFGGDLTLTDSGDLDQIALSGAADFFALTAAPAAANAIVNEGVAITPALLANYSDAYTLTVSVPDGWTAGILPGGTPVVTPTAKAVTGSAAVLLTVQSAQYPALFASATVELSLAANQAVDVTVVPDPLFTVPMGMVQGSDYDTPLTLNHAGDGRAEVPGAAFSVIVRNDSTAAATFDVSVTGLPAGWAVWSSGSGAQTIVTLAAGAQQTLGLYVVPPAGPLPAPGTNYPFTVTASDGSVTDSDSAAFTMPALPFPYLTVDPLAQTVLPGAPVTVTLALQNVGNSPASFPITVTVRDAHFSTAVLSPTALLSADVLDTDTLVPDATFTTDMVVDTGDALPGSVYFVEARSVAGEFDPMALAAVQFASLRAMPMLQTTACLPEPAQSATTHLVNAFLVVETSCADGNCLLQPRLDLLNAIDGYLAAAAASGYAGDSSAIAAARDDIVAQTTSAGLLAALDGLSTAVTSAGTDLCEINQHRVDGRFTPYVDAILLGDTADLTLDMTNLGTLTTTYAITVTGLPAGDQLFNETIVPGGTISLPINTTPAALGALNLTADIVAVAPDVQIDVRATAVARLNVVDKFVQVTQVIAAPAFVETGVSSTTLSVEIANVAAVAQEVNARTAVLAPNGDAAFTADVPLTVLVGAPRTYALTSVDTSGWAAGVYTVTVNLLDEADALISDGSGYGYLGVGQALGASHAVQPVVAAPGTVTVTTIITTAVLAGAILPPEAAPLWPATGLRSVITSPLSYADDPLPVVAEASPAITASLATDDQSLISTLQSPDTITGTVILRYEQDESVTTGSWQNIGYSQASNGTYWRADTAGETAEFTVTGTWVHLGFLADSNGGYAEILIDGISQGVVDLYRRDITPISFVYDGLSSGSHTVTIIAQGTANPLSSNDFVHLDYLDVYDSGSYADGSLEQGDTRIFRSGGWSNPVVDANASGGSYIRSNNAAVWFPFTGDSVTFQALAYPGGGKTKIYVDGVYQATIDLYNPLVSITRTVSFEGFGPGPHVTQISSYRGNTTIDAFITPGVSPFYTPPVPGSFARYEEEHPDFLLNGLPYAVTARTWTRDIGTNYSEASDGQVIYSRTAGDTASITFDGAWAGVGFYTNQNSGQAEIFVDGVSQGVVDLYSNEDDVISFSYDLTPGSHTLTVTVLGTANVLAGDELVHLDYVDVWDGSALPEGTFEELDGRVLRSGGWEATANASASGGVYIETGSGEPTVWFPFTGDSVTYQAFDYFRSDEVSVYIDEVFQGHYDIYTGAAPTITYSFDNLGPGLHILKIRDYREEPTLDAFITPATSPQEPPPPAQVFTRVEEDDTAVLYNGLPYPITASSWDRLDNVAQASRGQHAVSSTAGDTVSYEFGGTWVTAGFVTDFRSGQAEIFIDGASQGVVDLYSRDPDVAAFVFNGLSDTNHTISVTVLGTSHPNAFGAKVMFDCFDTWDGSDLPAGTYEETHPQVYLGDDFDTWDAFAEPTASGGSYLRDGFQRESAVWFPFTGDSVTFQGLANNRSDRVEISIDGVSYGTFNLYSGTPVTRPISFDGLGAGPHLMQVRHNRDYLAVDAFIVPGITPFYEPPAYTGIVRYEEDNPSLLYNGAYDWRTRPQTWYVNRNYSTVSGGWHVESNTAGNTVSLTFDGRWAAIGFRVRNVTSQAEIFIDGVSQGVFDLNNPTGEDVRSYQFGDLITGTHTISVSVVAGTVYFDYFDVWDGQPMSDELVNARQGEDSGRLHYTSNLEDATNANAIGGDMVVPGLWYAASNVWFSFVGDSFTLYGVTYIYDSSVDVYIDGVLVDTPQFKYPYTEQPRAFHYTGLEPGPHVVRISNDTTMRVDAFQANPAQPVPYLPLAEWWDNTPAGNGAPFFGTFGIAAGMTAGDLDGDGSVEIIVSGDDVVNFGTLFVFRGDGGDTGDGDPILWSHNFGGGVYRTWVSSPAIAELDGQPGAEVVVAAGDELWAFHADGSTYWMTDTVPIFETLSAPAIGNLDLDPEPEIVANLGGTVEVREHDGALAWSTAVPPHANPPVLADLTGDGLLDLILTGWDDDVLVYDYNNGAPQLAWSVVLTSSMAGTFGAPAVADIDGDGSPEVIVSHYGALTVLNGEDGSLLWTTPLDPGNPGGLSVADLDGDGEVNILTGMRYEFAPGRFGMLYALNPDGSLLWSAIAEDSSSANNASVLDLNGDGAYEVAWNGKEQGFTIYNGVDGAVLFNEPLANSATGTDYPLFVDVDGDSYAEVIVPTIRGLVVFGQDGVWGEARPLWNQHSYHITNVNDDLTIPQNEANSWEAHNTYRTQWPEAVALPVYDVVVTHTVGISGVTVLTDTFSVLPNVNADPEYRWDYVQTWAQSVVTRTFVSEIAGLQPGETRLVAQGTVVAYTLPSGSNRITLPPLYVSVPHVAAMAPESATAFAGTTAVYTLTLINPAAATASYTLSASGPAAPWLTLPATVDVPGGGSVDVPLPAAVPANAPVDSLPLIVDVVTDGGGKDTALARLVVADGLDTVISPAAQAGRTGRPMTYTLTLTNLETAARTYTLTVSGTADVSLPAVVTVPGGGTEQVALAAIPPGEGPQPFTIRATGDNGATSSTSAVATGLGRLGTQFALQPDTAAGGPGAVLTYTLVITNLGTYPDSYALDVVVPASWTAALAANGVTVDELTVPAGVFNRAELLLSVEPNVAAAPGIYSLTVTAVSQSYPGATAVVTGAAEVLDRGVQVAYSSGPAAIDPGQTAVWEVAVTNTGGSVDTFDLTSFGVLGGLAQLSDPAVTLNPGQSQTVQLAISGAPSLLPGPYTLGLLARSQADARVLDEAAASVTVNERQALVAGWQPASRTVTDTLQATMLLVVTNTGNVLTSCQLSVTLSGGTAVPLLDPIPLPPGQAMWVPVAVRVRAGGTYLLEATASSGGIQASAVATLTVDYEGPGPQYRKLYLPLLAMSAPLVVIQEPLSAETLASAGMPVDTDRRATARLLMPVHS